MLVIVNNMMTGSVFFSLSTFGTSAYLAKAVRCRGNTKKKEQSITIQPKMSGFSSKFTLSFFKMNNKNNA